MNTEVILLGSGGHAKVCIEILQSMGERIAFCVGAHDSDERCMGIPVLKGDEHLSRLRSQGFFRLFPALGDNKLRERLSLVAIEQGYELVSAISSHAVVSPSATIGVGVAVMAGVVMNADVQVDDFSVINTGATLDHDVRIGQSTHIAPQCALAGNVAIGIRSFLGIGVKVIPKITVGDDVVIGAGAVVTSNVPGRALAVGVPAKIINYIED